MSTDSKGGIPPKGKRFGLVNIFALQLSRRQAARSQEDELCKDYWIAMMRWRAIRNTIRWIDIGYND